MFGVNSYSCWYNRPKPESWPGRNAVCPLMLVLCIFSVVPGGFVSPGALCPGEHHFLERRADVLDGFDLLDRVCVVLRLVMRANSTSPRCRWRPAWTLQPVFVFLFLG